MKFTVTMKDPDTLHDAIKDAVEEDLAKIEGLDDGDREALAERREEITRGIASTWFRYGEYLSVEIDTDAMTCTVLQDRD
jgi:hypothetical protein